MTSFVPVLAGSFTNAMTDKKLFLAEQECITFQCMPVVFDPLSPGGVANYVVQAATPVSYPMTVRWTFNAGGATSGVKVIETQVNENGYNASVRPIVDASMNARAGGPTGALHDWRIKGTDPMPYYDEHSRSK